jgi:predicted nucleic-acid-binding Zn-ribbon protein
MQEKITCPKCGFEQQENTECLKCGIVFSKFRSVHKPALINSSTKEHSNYSESAELLDTADRWIYRTGKYIIIGIMSLFFFYMIIKRSSWCFLDYVNLPFHEFGHILFSPFGETIQFMGGTISQLMWPVILMVYFIRRTEPLSASFCLFWFGENFLNISKYIADARSMELPLVGGGIHDWNFLLSKWHALQYDHAIANIIFVLGVIQMTGSMVWAFLAKPKGQS